MSDTSGSSTYAEDPTITPYSYADTYGTMSGTCQAQGSVTTTYSFGDTTGSLTQVEEYVSSYQGNEVFSCSMMGGLVTGAVHESGSSTFIYSTTWQFGRGEDGTWSVVSGTGFDQCNWQDHADYSGGGSYSNSGDGYSLSGTTDTSGRRNSGGTQHVDCILSNGAWVKTSATGTGNMDMGDDWKSGGIGAYTLTDMGLSGSGKMHASDWNGWSYVGNWTIKQNADGTWALTDGTGTSHSYNGSNYGFEDNGDNTYTYANANGSGSGTFTDQLLKKGEEDYSAQHQVVDGKWKSTGTGSGSYENRRHYNYNGKGIYWNTAFAGGVTDNGGYNMDSVGNWKSALTDNGTWKLSEGTGVYDLRDEGHTTWQGDGQYETSSASGTLKDDALDTYLTTIHTKSSVANGAWITTGDRTFSSSGHDKQTYDGDGDFSTTTGGLTISGTTSEDGLRNSSYDFSGQGKLSGGLWTYSGSGFNQIEASDGFGYEGSGSASTQESTSSSGSSSSHTSSASVTEDGEFEKSSSFRQDYDLAIDGSAWLLAQQTTTSGQSASGSYDSNSDQTWSSASVSTAPPPMPPESYSSTRTLTAQTQTEYSADRTATSTLVFQDDAPPLYAYQVSGGGQGTAYTFSDDDKATQRTMGFAQLSDDTWTLSESDLNYNWTYAAAGDKSTASGTVTSKTGGRSDVWQNGIHVVSYPWSQGGTQAVNNQAGWMTSPGQFGFLETTAGTFNGSGIIGGSTPGVTYTPGSADDGLSSSPDAATPCASGGGSGPTVSPQSTPPTAPPYGEIARGGNVRIVNQFGGTQQAPGVQIEHGPAHVHVKGGGPEVSVGQNGKPLNGQPELTKTQEKVVEDNLAKIRRVVGKTGRWLAAKAAAAAAAAAEATEVLIIIIPTPAEFLDPCPHYPWPGEGAERI